MYNDILEIMNNLNNYMVRDIKSFPVDIVENQEGYVVLANLPGYQKENIKLDFQNGILKIFAKASEVAKEKYILNERVKRDRMRELNFGDINVDNIKAKYENGVLIVNILLKKPEVKPTANIVIEGSVK